MSRRPSVFQSHDAPSTVHPVWGECLREIRSALASAGEPWRSARCNFLSFHHRDRCFYYRSLEAIESGVPESLVASVDLAAREPLTARSTNVDAETARRLGALVRDVFRSSDIRLLKGHSRVPASDGVPDEPALRADLSEAIEHFVTVAVADARDAHRQSLAAAGQFPGLADEDRLRLVLPAVLRSIPQHRDFGSVGRVHGVWLAAAEGASSPGAVSEHLRIVLDHDSDRPWPDPTSTCWIPFRRGAHDTPLAWLTAFLERVLGVQQPTEVSLLFPVCILGLLRVVARISTPEHAFRAWLESNDPSSIDAVLGRLQGSVTRSFSDRWHWQKHVQNLVDGFALYHPVTGTEQRLEDWCLACAEHLPLYGGLEHARLELTRADGSNLAWVGSYGTPVADGAYLPSPWGVREAAGQRVSSAKPDVGNTPRDERRFTIPLRHPTHHEEGLLSLRLSWHVAPEVASPSYRLAFDWLRLSLERRESQLLRLLVAMRPATGDRIGRTWLNEEGVEHDAASSEILHHLVYPHLVWRDRPEEQAKHRLRLNPGVLICGRWGIGKSLAVDAAAEHLNPRSKAARLGGGTFESDRWAAGVVRVNRFFRALKGHAETHPREIAIGIVEEFNTASMERATKASQGGMEETARMTGAFRTWLDDIDAWNRDQGTKHGKILVLLSTNDLDAIDDGVRDRLPKMTWAASSDVLKALTLRLRKYEVRGTGESIKVLARVVEPILKSEGGRTYEWISGSLKTFLHQVGRPGESLTEELVEEWCRLGVFAPGAGEGTTVAGGTVTLTADEFHRLNPEARVVHLRRLEHGLGPAGDPRADATSPLLQLLAELFRLCATQDEFYTSLKDWRSERKTRALLWRAAKAELVIVHRRATKKKTSA